MKTTILLFSLLILNSVLAGRDSRISETGTIVVEIVGLRSDKGDVKISLYNQKDGFLSDSSKALRLLRFKIEKDRCLANITNLPYGTYAIAGYHDENSDGRLNFNFLHVPREGVCASNDAKGHFGPPSFDDAKFLLKSASLSIKMTMSY
jgi:uncharacterized protein (DUF2141 family)